MSVLRQFAEPILFEIKPWQEEYSEAQRLIKFLSKFLTMESNYVNNNSILREFIGGSCYK